MGAQWVCCAVDGAEAVMARKSIHKLREEVARLKRTVNDGGLQASARTMVESELNHAVRQLVRREMNMRGR